MKDYDNTDEEYPKLRRLPKGCDYQGRYPGAAEAATDLGADDGIDEMGKVFAWAVVAIVAVTLIAISVAIWGG